MPKDLQFQDHISDTSDDEKSSTVSKNHFLTEYQTKSNTISMFINHLPQCKSSRSRSSRINLTSTETDSCFSKNATTSSNSTKSTSLSNSIFSTCLIPEKFLKKTSKPLVEDQQTTTVTPSAEMPANTEEVPIQFEQIDNTKNSQPLSDDEDDYENDDEDDADQESRIKASHSQVITESTDPFLMLPESERRRFAKLRQHKHGDNTGSAAPSSTSSSSILPVKKIRMDDLVEGTNIEMTKNLTEDDREIHTTKLPPELMPSKTASRKNQITFLTYKWREQEFEDQNKWALGKAKRQESKNRYGF